MKVNGTVTLDKLKIPDILKHEFLLCEDGSTEEKIFIFATPLGIKTFQLYADKEMVYGDGTFETSPKPFPQVFGIHIDLQSTQEPNIIPVIYALLPNKTTETYIRLFSLIKEK